MVTKDELLDAVWSETAVTDAVVRVAIVALRKALGDTAPPRLIATVSRRGYRFLAPVTVADAPERTAVLPPLTPSYTCSLPLLVGREAILQRLEAAWARARQGQRQIVLVTGEAGIGKTTVVERFVRQSRRTRPCGWPRPMRRTLRYGGSLPAGPGGPGSALPCTGRRATRDVVAPACTHLAGTAALAAHDRDREQWRYELQGATRERMLREFAALVDKLTAETLLVLILEDLHWSDYATLDLLALLARRRTPARLLVIGPYPPVEAIVQDHPLRTVAQDLRQHGHATEVPLAL